ncbi:26S proteasome non-ATPase regulatory subunit 9 [Sporothrix brasiliensis 5110]|uniref:Probable 26S proteasome regulatory subunit p27 n=1 Tax=Sporothrix brasiliensis 5110 TaxID=1398154 RepID=A0A0C2IH04_9PEZI|nr:26S proteasome non-ATPase regulatory subunit 9 [Sporothrix brasiliensis 5110]KIH88501.1 26S proteasome non-ATPase regulatory subunit 9 [Sporothrix brasiliensis 5110]
MNNIHAPTVPSGPTTARQTNGDAKNLSFTELQRKKENMEAELTALGSVLDSVGSRLACRSCGLERDVLTVCLSIQHNVDMNTPLLTPDGYPRADIDVAQIRTTRSRIVHLRNDYKDLMGVIEKFLHEHFASLDADATGAQDRADNAGAPAAQILPDSVPEALEPPFAKVNSVVHGSPAADAGLQGGDQIRSFGYVNHANHDGLKKVGECVAGNEGQRILVKVARSTGSGRLQEIRLNLTPRRNWGGRGLLGCHILPI